MRTWLTNMTTQVFHSRLRITQKNTGIAAGTHNRVPESDPQLQTRLNEGVQVSIQHPLGIAHFIVGA